MLAPAATNVIRYINEVLLVDSVNAEVVLDGNSRGDEWQIEAPLVDVGSPASKEITAGSGNLKGDAVLVDPHDTADNPAFVMRHALANELAAAGASARVIPLGLYWRCPERVGASMSTAPQPTSLKHAQDAVNQSRNERQKFVLLIEVANQIRATMSRLIEETKELLAHTKALCQGISDENRRR